MKRAEWKRSIKCGGVTWKVRLVPADALGNRGKVTTLGLVCPKSKTIKIWIGLKGRARWNVLLHELFHVAWAERHGWNGVGLDREESINHLLTTATEAGLYDILNRNFGFGPDGD